MKITGAIMGVITQIMEKITQSKGMIQKLRE